MREPHNLLKGQFFTPSHVWHWHVRVGPLCNLIRDGRPQKGLHTEQGKGRQKKVPVDEPRVPSVGMGEGMHGRCSLGAAARPGQFLLHGLATPSGVRQPIHLASVGASGAEHGGGAAAAPLEGRGEGTASGAGELTRREASKDQVH